MREAVGQGGPPASAPGDRPRLLVVDDEPDMLDFVERSLRRRFDVSRCGNPEEALERLEGGGFEVLITDQKMPRLSGLELLEQLGDRHPRLVRVLLSGFAELPEVKRAKARSQIHNYVLKPVDSDTLVRAVDEAYAARDGRAWDLDPDLD